MPSEFRKPVEFPENESAMPVGVADQPDGLSAILNPACAATIWHRQPLPAFQSWIDNLIPEQLPKGRVILRPVEIRHAATQICEICGTPNCGERALLIDDTAALASLFSSIMGARYLRLRFDVIQSNGCQKFRTDAVTARLICTYRGTGMQYGISMDGDDPSHIQTVSTGAPMLLRGSKWPANPNSGLSYRSPPIEGVGETRLVLVLDPVADPDGPVLQKSVH